MKKSVRAQIEQHLIEGKTITPLQALETWGCFRLASIIHRIRKSGMNIETMPHTFKGKTYAVYQAHI